MRSKRSPIWKIPHDQLVELVKSSKMFSDILKFFGLRNKGGNFRTLKARLNQDNIDYSHIPQGLGANRGRTVFTPAPKEYSELFVRDSKHSRSTIKKRILTDKLIEYKCVECGLPPIWNNKPLSLILDHKNGIHNDHRLENLRFVCPHCDQQSDTFGSKNIKYIPKRYNCKHCGKKITKFSKTLSCSRCYSLQHNQKKVSNRPSREELQNMIEREPMTRIAKRYGITDKAVHKWCKSYGIKRLGAGYWAKTYGFGKVVP